MKILIIEDEYWAQQILESIISKHVGQVSFRFANDVQSSIRMITSFQPDLIFMDIKLGSEDSFEIFNQMPDAELDIIFVTSYQEFALNAFKVNAIDYVLKPVKEEDIVHAIKKFTKSMNKNDTHERNKDKLLIYKSDRLVPIEINKIIKLKSENQYTCIYTTDQQKVISSKSLSHFELELDKKKFARIHHSFIINLDYIKNIKTGLKPSVLMINDESIPISRRKKQALLDMFSK